MRNMIGNTNSKHGRATGSPVQLLDYFGTFIPSAVITSFSRNQFCDSVEVHGT